MPTRLLFPGNKPPTFWRRMVQAFVLTSVEAFLALICLLAGLPVLIDPSTFAPAVVRHIGEWVAYPWATGMLTGGVLTLAGIAKGEYRLERMGNAILGFVASVFCIALLGVWPVSWFALLTYIAFALAMAARYWVLGKMLKLNSEWRQRMMEMAERSNGKDGS